MYAYEENGVCLKCEWFYRQRDSSERIVHGGSN